MERAATELEYETRIAAPPEVVFGYFTDPSRIVTWMGIGATLDPRPGGVFRLEVNGEDVAAGHYAEVVPHERVVFTWGWEGAGSGVPPGSTRVEVTLRPEGDGDTVVRLRHLDLPEPAREPHAHGWEHYVARLAEAAAGGDPGRDPWIKTPA